MAIAIGFEIAGTSALKYSDGFTRPAPTAITLGAYAIAFYLMSLVTRTLEVSTVYAIWSGAGISLLTLIGYFVLGESLSPLKAGSIALIVCGIVGLNLAGAGH
ncbi:MAG: ligand-binding protein SH3 [Chloroflexi bacterium]|nr:MAG: ligand-binding protein SH3 [Chloroflexota bacterium]